jgi:hypothetical protein
MHWSLLRINKEVMLPYGIGYKGLVHAIFTTKEKEFLHS